MIDTKNRNSFNGHLMVAGMAILLSLPGTLGAVNIPDCGGDGQKACDGSQFEWSLLMDSTLGKRCEYDLQNVNGMCVNETRKTLAKQGGWLGFALAEQRYGIAGNDPVNFQTWLGARNAYASFQQGFKIPLNTDQYFSITDVLQMGYRFLEIEPHWSLGRMVVCPNGVDTCRDPQLRLWGHVLLELKKWLEANPGEFVVVMLNDHIAGKEAELTDPISYFLGTKVVRRPTNPTAWPKINEQLGLGKQILFMSRNTEILNDGLVWAANTNITERDHPIASNLDACVDGDGKSMNNHFSMWWSALFEGRSARNLLDLTGLMYEEDVTKAVNCGASIVGLGFINALSAAHPPFNRDGYDGRREASIWSWAANDFGVNGPAVMRNDGRWVSRAINEVHRYACASTSRTLSNWNERGWIVTSQTGPWSNGAAACKALGNYEFAAPTNGYQNRRLNIASNGGEIWLNYKAPTADMLKVSTNVVNLTHIQGDILPEPATFTLYGVPGAQVVWYQNDPGTIKKTILTSNLIGATGSTATIALTEAAANLAPGTYSWQVRFSSSGFNEGVTVNLVVRGRTTMQLWAAPQATANMPFAVQLQLQAAPGMSDYKLYAYDLTGKFLGTIAAGSYSGGTTGGAMNFAAAVNGLAAGTYQITGVNVPRDANWLNTEAEPVTVVVQ